jgi:hypothetical protein
MAPFNFGRHSRGEEKKRKEEKKKSLEPNRCPTINTRQTIGKSAM